MAVDLQTIISGIAQKKYKPVYLICGEEPYYIDVISDFIEDNVVDDSMKEFNLSILYGRDTDAGKVIEYAKRYPMMADHQVVIVKEAQEMKSIEELTTYIEKPLESTLLVLCYKHKKYDKRKSLAKLAEKKGIYYESARIYPDKIQGWINDYVTSKGYKITPKAAILIGDFLGTDLSKVVNEINKLFINLPKGSTIDENITEKNIGISKDYNFFEFQSALASRNIEKANTIVNFFNSNPKENPLAKIVPMMFYFFQKALIASSSTDKSPAGVAEILGMTPFIARDYAKTVSNYSYQKLTEVISILREYDLKSKGVDSANTDSADLMREMIFRILH